jgi:hypothetical protein
MFAIVLGLAAIASSIARPPDDEDRRAGQADRGGDAARTGGDGTGTGPSAAPRPGTPSPAPATVRFRAGAKRQIRELEQGRPATLVVAVETPSQVDIPSLGLTQPAEPLTPARFDVLAGETGAHRIVLRPAASDAIASTVGTLRVVPRRPLEAGSKGR